MEYKEDDFLLLSGIQHFVFCKRQWALIHIEQQWQDNVRTFEGEILHEKAHDVNLKESRGDLIISRGMGVFSSTLGIVGSCDVVEFNKSPLGVNIYGKEGKYLPVPVEYKRGKPKENDADELQLCAQVMCLEEMLLCTIPEGFLYYGEIKHRNKIIIDDNLRNRVKQITKEMHEFYDRRYTPRVKKCKSCKSCSLFDLCMPQLFKTKSVNNYISSNIMEVED